MYLYINEDIHTPACCYRDPCVQDYTLITAVANIETDITNNTAIGTLKLPQRGWSGCFTKARDNILEELG